jgi:hypothetical protein
MMNRRLFLVVVSAVVLLMLVPVVSAAPAAPGTPTLRWITTSPTTAEIRADGIANGGGQANNGAISWDIYLRFPNTVASPYPAISAVPGPAWTGLNCGFAVPVFPGQPSAPGATGDRGVFLNGSCSSGFPASSVTGSDVLLATLTFASCPSGSSGFVMDLDSGDDVYGTPVAQMVDRSNDSYFFSDSDLTDGDAMCAPTAVTMSGFDATTGSAAPFVASAWPLLAGAVAVAAGGAYALLRRKS